MCALVDGSDPGRTCSSTAGCLFCDPMLHQGPVEGQNELITISLQIQLRHLSDLLSDYYLIIVQMSCSQKGFEHRAYLGWLMK